MAQFPSLKTLVQESVQTFYRFPFVLLSAIAGTLTAINLSRLPYDRGESEETHICLILVCGLGIPLFLAFSLLAERKRFSKKISLGIQAAGIGLLAAYFIYLRANFVQVEFIRFALFALAFHLFASFAAFTDRNQLTGFWQFNKALFLRLFFGAIYSATLYLGIALAILAVDQLFNVSISDRNYFRVWLLITGIFNTWFFLAGVPRDLEGLNLRDDYPKGLKIFTQYVLLPLVTLYLVILYLYMGKILFAQSLPKGWVSYLVLGFSILGILALLLIYPIRNSEGNSWIRIFSRWFYGALYPLVIMLFIAIGRRIGDYGITENRYFIVLLAVWLLCISTYFLFGKKWNIRYIPMSLCLIALFSSFGPWGAFSVSEKSQYAVLENILEENKVLVNGKVDAKHAEVPDSVAEQVTSIVSYFSEVHGFKKFRPWFDTSIDSLIESRDRWNKAADFMKLLNIRQTYNYGYYHDEDGQRYRNFSYYPEDNYTSARAISGYDYEISFNATAFQAAGNSKYSVGQDSLAFTLSKDSVSLDLEYNNRLVARLDLNSYLKTIDDSAKRKNAYNTQVPRLYMEKILEDSTMRIKLQFNNIYGIVKKDFYKTTSAGGNCLIKLKNKVAE